LDTDAATAGGGGGDGVELMNNPLTDSTNNGHHHNHHLRPSPTHPLSPPSYLTLRSHFVEKWLEEGLALSKYTEITGDLSTLVRHGDPFALTALKRIAEGCPLPETLVNQGFIPAFSLERLRASKFRQQQQETLPLYRYQTNPGPYEQRTQSHHHHHQQQQQHSHYPPSHHHHHSGEYERGEELPLHRLFPAATKQGDEEGVGFESWLGDLRPFQSDAASGGGYDMLFDGEDRLNGGLLGGLLDEFE